MASTTFVDGETLIEAAWLNDVNAVVYTPGTSTAADIANVPAGNIDAIDVQTAINELDTEKQPIDALLTALAAQTTAANNVQAYSGVDTPTLLSTGIASGNIPLVGTKSATEILPGLVELATQAEAEAGADDTVVMTPLKTAQAIAARTVQSHTGTGGVASAGAVLSVVFASGDIIPLDDTIPQNTEGEPVLDAAITTRAGTSLLVRLVLPLTSGGGISTVTAAIFVDSDASAVAASTVTIGGANYCSQIILEHEITGLSAAAHTIKVRFGPSAAATVIVNGNSSGTRLFGGVSTASLTLTEI